MSLPHINLQRTSTIPAVLKNIHSNSLVNDSFDRNFSLFLEKNIETEVERNKVAKYLENIAKSAEQDDGSVSTDVWVFGVSSVKDDLSIIIQYALIYAIALALPNGVGNTRDKVDAQIGEGRDKKYYVEYLKSNYPDFIIMINNMSFFRKKRALINIGFLTEISNNS